MYCLRAKTSFEAGHRLYLHKGKCSTPHGHNYGLDVEMYFENSILREGMLLDFFDVERELDKIRRWLDHSFIVCSEDPFLHDLQGYGKVVVLSQQPTAEVLCVEIYKRILPAFPEVSRLEVTIHETEKYSVSYDGE